MMRPIVGDQPSLVVMRVSISSQIASSDQRSIGSSGGTCKYSRVIVGERMLNSANPRSWSV